MKKIDITVRRASIPMQSPASLTRNGFTIVELLIVIVVIGILAGITIVAYNGISNKARVTALQSDLSQVVTQLEIFRVGDAASGYPATLTAAALKASPGVTYQYTVNNGVSPATYCVTGTINSTSYYVSNTTTIPTTGACLGHINGGAPIVTNRFINPNFSGTATPVGQTGTNATLATCNGSMAAQGTTTITSNASMRLQPPANRWVASAGQAVYGSATVYNGAASDRILALSLRFYDTAGSSTGTEVAGGTVYPTPSSQTIPAGGTYNFSVATTAPAGTASVGLSVNRVTGSGSAIGDIYCADNAYLSDTPSAYADGGSPGWVWNGMANDSTSTGPAL